jgi:hypothetical protein
MIYNFTVNISEKKSKPIFKQFYITADSDSAFYKRCLEQYRVQRHQIDIIEIIPDAEIDPNLSTEKHIGYKPSKEVEDKIDILKNLSEDYTTQIDEMMKKPRGLGESDIQSKAEEGWVVVETTTPVTDLKVALELYKKVKLYYKRTGAKKNKLYIILCKDKLKESSGKKSLKSVSPSSKGEKQRKQKKSTQKKSG